MLIVWLASASLVGVAADRRNRDGINWFIIATIISPPLAALLVWALPRIEPSDSELALKRRRPVLERQSPAEDFVPDGIYGEIPYRVTRECAIDAVMSHGVVRFQTMEQFLVAATETAEASRLIPTDALRPALAPQEHTLIQPSKGVTAIVSGKSAHTGIQARVG